MAVKEIDWSASVMPWIAGVLHREEALGHETYSSTVSASVPDGHQPWQLAPATHSSITP
jgi:hypothetical protein